MDEIAHGGARMYAEVKDRMGVVQGDITELVVDAIGMRPTPRSSMAEEWTGSSIGRPGLLVECRLIGGCPPGQARMTGGHRLPARHVIHTVGPVYDRGRSGEPESLESCYRESLRLASEAGLSSVAFPCISTGAYGYPPEQACEIAVAVVAEWLVAHDRPRIVTFCCFRPEDAGLYRWRLRGWRLGALALPLPPG